MQSRAESFRELAMQATNRAAEYKAKAERHAQQGNAQIAAEYQPLADGAAARSERYRVLADFAERKFLAAHW